MTPASAFHVAHELMALRRVYAALAPVAFLEDERAAVDRAFRDHELYLVCVLRELEPVLLAAVNARLACGAPAIRQPAADAPHPPEPIPLPALTPDLQVRGRVH